MENGDLRAAVRAFLLPRSPNCTSHMRLFADGRDPPLPTALHVSTLRCRGITGFGCADLGTGGPEKKRCLFSDSFNAHVDVSAVVATGIYSPRHLRMCHGREHGTWPK